MKITNGQTIVDIPIKKEYTLNGIKLFIHRPYNFVTGDYSKDGWNVSEYYTGLYVGMGNTIVEAMGNAEMQLTDHKILTPINMIDFTKSYNKINI
jgi:hypothetical protein